MARSPRKTELLPPIVDLDWRLSEYRRQLEYVGESYRSWKDAERYRPTFNESLVLLQRQFHAPNRKRRDPVRLHPLTEIGISMITLRARGGRSCIDFSPADLEIASREFLRRTKPVRGRPENLILRYHVKGLILAGEWATGEPVTASLSKNSVYDARMTSDGGFAIEMAFRRIDPTVTSTALVNIILNVRGTHELEGKRFEDLFPCYRPAPHPDLGVLAGPPVNLHLAYPIYSS